MSSYFYKKLCLLLTIDLRIDHSNAYMVHAHNHLLLEDVMVKIRLSRGGSKKHPFYRIVVASKERSRDGRFIERIGYYDPNVDNVKVDLDRVSYWEGVGAKLSPTVSTIVRAYRKKSSPVHLS